jgi:hypothetical protein
MEVKKLVCEVKENSTKISGEERNTKEEISSADPQRIAHQSQERKHKGRINSKEIAKEEDGSKNEHARTRQRNRS